MNDDALPDLQKPFDEGLRSLSWSDGQGGLAVRFAGDENLVLSMNGPGKSTMLLLLKQMIEGPVRLRSPGFVGERQADWVSADANMFAVRAIDDGIDATAELVRPTHRSEPSTDPPQVA